MLQTEQDLQAKSGGLHYAFVICLGGFLLSGIVLAAQRLPSIALDSVRQTLGVGYAEVGLITSVFMIFYAGLSLVWGMLGDKIGTRWAMTLACALSSVGTILFGLFGGTSLAAAIVTWSICGIGCAGLLMAILPKIISRWFAPNKRGFGMSLCTPGANFAALILGVVAPLVINGLGWNMAYVAFGIYFALITVFVGLTFREGPEEKGLAPYGAPKGTQAAPAPKLEEKAVASGKKVSPLRQVARMGITWHFGLFYAVYQLGYMAATQYYVVSMTGNGFDLATAAFSLTIGGVLTIITELIVGSLSDRFERKNMIGIMVACTGVLSAGYAIYLLNTPAPYLIPCYFFIALISASTGVITVIMSGAGEYYNDECRATGTGMIGTINIVGRYLGPWVAGIVIDATGQTAYAFVIVAVAMIVSCFIAFAMPRAATVQAKWAANN